MIAHTLSLGFPKLQAIRLNLDGLTRNQAAREAYLKDPLINQGYLNLCTGDSILSSCSNLWQHLPEITVPIYIIHGKEDKIVSAKGSQFLHERIGTPPALKKLYIPDQVKHEPWEDPIIDEIIRSIITWFSAYPYPQLRAQL